MLAIFLILTCTVSLTLYGEMDVAIHNQHSDIELISPVYFCDSGTYNEYPVERTDASTMIKVGLKFCFDRLPGGILMYEVQKNTKSDHHTNTDTTFTEATEDTSKTMRLLVVWKIKYSKRLRVHMMLVEHNNKLVLNEDKLAQLYNKINEQFSEHDGPSKCTWLMCDNAVLAATYKVARKTGLELKITITKEGEGKDTMRPMWIDSERQVSFLTI
jgi:hypothetical protein